MRTIILFSFIWLSGLTASGQYRSPYAYPGPQQQSYDSAREKKGFDPSRLVFGGNLGVSFGDFTFVNITPQVGYQFSNMFTAGLGVNYIYSGIKYRDASGRELYKENFGYAGMGLFGRFFPTDFLFAMVQPEINYSWGNVEVPGQPTVKLESAWVPSFLVGAGVMIGGRGGRGGMMLSIQYDLAQDPRSPYGSQAFFGMGYAF